jgi:hypothetical protein
MITKPIYILVSSSRERHLSSAQYFDSLSLAKKALQEKKKDLKSCLCKHNIDVDTDVKFSFIFGWEEHYITWEIIEKQLIISDGDCDELYG